MKIEVLYNDKWNTTTFYIWKNMELVDKFIFEGKMTTEEIKDKKKQLSSKTENCNISKEK